MDFITELDTASWPGRANSGWHPISLSPLLQFGLCCLGKVASGSIYRRHNGILRHGDLLDSLGYGVLAQQCGGEVGGRLWAPGLIDPASG